MGIDISITKDGKFITEVGRAHNFTKTFSSELDLDYDDLERDIHNIENDVVDDIKNMITFMKGRESTYRSLCGIKEDDSEEFNKVDFMFDELVDNIEYLRDESIKTGKKMLLSYILEDDGMSYEMEE